MKDFYLRSWNLKDAPALAKAADNPHIAANLRNVFPHPYTLEDAQWFIRDCMEKEGEKQIRENLGYYRKNAEMISACLDELGIWYTGGKNSPYIWMQCPDGMDSWEFFDYLLENANVVGPPGSGFGRNGEGFFRLTAFGSEENTREACRRIKQLLKK